MLRMYVVARGEMEEGNIEALPELHATSAVLKAFSTEIACKGMEVSVQSSPTPPAWWTVDRLFPSCADCLVVDMATQMPVGFHSYTPTSQQPRRMRERTLLCTFKLLGL